MMPTNEDLRDYLAGRIPLEKAEEIEQQLMDSATLQAQITSLPDDPMLQRLRQVWKRQNPTSDDGQSISVAPPDDDDQLLIDRYRLIEVIGTGGMGQVWKARPIHRVAQTVALKLVKPGLDSRSIIGRFELERNALAMMDHPCIAKILDGGSTDAGQSYFVMELVDGSSITHHCHEHLLSIDQRLRLFVQVCRAVQHAHQKGILHRDLKPSNILVTQYDGQPLPKVIDFGLAKVLGDAIGDHSQLTEYGVLVGTVRYMSPEQVELKSWDIDTRSDIYSLGIVLYELLTGTTPIQWPTGCEHSLLDVLRAVRETEPTRPSERLRDSLASGLADPSVNCRSSRQILRRDLDWIVMKAIEKNRDRRYQTADALAQDIDRYLTGQPVTARPPSVIYRVDKFVKKHRGLVTVAMATFVMVLAGAASLLWSAQANSQKRAVFAAASYGSIINELNVLSLHRNSGWTHRGLQLVENASAMTTPLRDSRQLRDWVASMVTVPDVDMTVRKRFAAELSPTDITYSPSGRRLAVGLATTDTRQQCTVVLIDLETDQEQWLTPEAKDALVDEGSDPSVTSLRFGQDDDTLFVGTRNGLLLRLQLDQSPPALTYAHASRGGVLVRLSKDGRYCVTATSRQQKQSGEHDERMRCFNAQTLEQLGESEFNERVMSLSVAPDSSRASVCRDIQETNPPESTEFSLPDFKQLRTFAGENAEYHPLGHALFTGGRTIYKRVTIDNPSAAAIYLPGTNLTWIPHRVPTFQHLQLADNGSILAASLQADKCIDFWRESDSLPFMKFRLSENRNIIGYAIAPALDSIAVLTDDALEMYSFTNRRDFQRIIGLQTRANYFAMAPDEREFATHSDLEVCRYETTSGQALVSQPAITSTATRNSIAYDSSNRLLALTRVLEARMLAITITDRANATNDHVFRVPCEPAERFDAPKLAGLGWIDSDHLIAAIHYRLMVWNTQSGRLEVSMPQRNPTGLLPIYRAIVTRRDQCITIDDEGSLTLWHWSGNELIKSQPSIGLKTSEAERLAWHPGGDLVIVGTQSGSIQLVDLKRRRAQNADHVHLGEISGAAWLSAERLVTTSRDGKLALWRLSSNGVLQPYAVWDTRSGITAIEVSADGQRCYVVSASESIAVINLAALEAKFIELGIAEVARFQVPSKL